MVVLGKPVRFVADVLQQPEGEGMPAEMQRLVPPHHKDLFFALGQREDQRRIDVQLRECGQACSQLSDPAVDEENVGNEYRISNKEFRMTKFGGACGELCLATL